MKIQERRAWAGRIRVTARDLEGNITDVEEFDNLLTTTGFNMVRDGLFGDVSDFEVKALTIGDDATAPTIADTVLGNETFRKARTSQSKPADGQVQYFQYISPSEAVGTIEELGWVAGAAVNTASPAGKDTGIMIARVLYSRNKTALESLQIERVDSVAEA